MDDVDFFKEIKLFTANKNMPSAVESDLGSNENDCNATNGK